MNKRDFFFEQVIMLLAVVIPLAMAEGVWWYLAGVVASVMIGAWTRFRRKRPPLGPITSRAFVLLAFSWLLYEHLWLMAIPVMALSHFMTLVCISKFLQQRTLRDDAQLAVLSLLLLVVAAIVSGNVIFLGALIVSMTAGLGMLIRFHLAVERSHIERANAAFRAPAGAVPAGVVPAPGGAAGMTAAIGLFSVAAGVVVFMLFPRVGAGMFGRVDTRSGGPASTGISMAINFDHAGPVNESDRQVMRVKIEATHGSPPSGQPVYLRGRVYDFYDNRGGRGWEWTRAQRRPRVRSFAFEELGRDEPVRLLPELDTTGRPMLLARFQLEAGALTDGLLFTLYPPVELQGLNSDEVQGVNKIVFDQTLRTSRPTRKALRYTVASPEHLDDEVRQALYDERASASASLREELRRDGGLREPERRYETSPQPEPRVPRPPLPLDARVRELVEPLKTAAGPLDVPANREKFAASVVDFLKSDRFTYTLSPQMLRPGTEPVGKFLVDQRQGYCQHFASAMVVMCQLAGVPARLVSGFLCDDYNDMGNFYSVRAKHAHAWVEVYIPGKDWVLYDPTPAGSGRRADMAWLQMLRRYSDYLQFQWASLVLTYDADARRELLTRFKEWLLRPARSEATLLGRVLAFVLELFTWRVQMTWQDRLLYWVFALLVVAMVVLIGYVVVVLLWRAAHRVMHWHAARRVPGHRAGDAGLYHRFSRRMAGIGVRRRPDQTPAEFAADLASRFPLLEPAPELVSAHYEVIYGQRSLSPERRQSFEHFLAELNRTDSAGLAQPPALAGAS